jgi:hypothetical protein
MLPVYGPKSSIHHVMYSRGYEAKALLKVVSATEQVLIELMQ